MTSTNEAGPLTVGEYLSAIRPVPADVRISYDEGPSQWIDIFRPVEPASSAVIILVHGGCWSAAASAETTSPNAAELAVNGVTVCNVEYRRIGEPGGGFPGTFYDVAKAAETLRARALELQLDLSRVIVVGHSAGAHLALWMASRAKLPTGSPLHVADPLKIHSVVAIAGPGDLRNHARLMGITCAGLSRLDQLVGEPTPSRPIRWRIRPRLTFCRPGSGRFQSPAFMTITGRRTYRSAGIALPSQRVTMLRSCCSPIAVIST